MTDRPQHSLTKTIPPPSAIRARLGELVRETQVLRKLLRVSLSVNRDRSANGETQAPDAKPAASAGGEQTATGSVQGE